MAAVEHPALVRSVDTRAIPKIFHRGMSAERAARGLRGLGGESPSTQIQATGGRSLVPAVTVAARLPIRDSSVTGRDNVAPLDASALPSQVVKDLGHHAAVDLIVARDLPHHRRFRERSSARA